MEPMIDQCDPGKGVRDELLAALGQLVASIPDPRDFLTKARIELRTAFVRTIVSRDDEMAADWTQVVETEFDRAVEIVLARLD